MDLVKTRCDEYHDGDDMVKFSRQFLTQLADAVVQARANEEEDEHFMDTIIQET